MIQLNLDISVLFRLIVTHGLFINLKIKIIEFLDYKEIFRLKDLLY